MSTLSHYFFPRSMFDMDLWSRPSLLESGPSTLDLFDAFDELDRAMSRNIHWLNEPEVLSASAPRVEEKYRITLDCQGYSPSSIKTNVKGNKLIVSGSEGKTSPNTDFSMREFRKTYELPKYVNGSKLVSFLTTNGELVIEFPIKEIKPNKIELQPKIVDTKDGNKRVELNVDIPENINPNEIIVTCKDRDVIIKADYKVEKEGGKSRVHYYRRATMPENADLNSLKCVLENNTLNLTANLTLNLKVQKVIPIEIANKEQMQQSQEQQLQQQSQQGQQPIQTSQQMRSQKQEIPVHREQQHQEQQPQQPQQLQQQSQQGQQPIQTSQQMRSQKQEIPVHREQQHQEQQPQQLQQKSQQWQQLMQPIQRSNKQESQQQGIEIPVKIEPQSSQRQQSKPEESCSTCKGPVSQKG